MKFLRRLSLIIRYELSWIIFATISTVLNIGCALLLLFPNRKSLQPKVRKAIRNLFRGWIQWQHMTGITSVHFHGFENVSFQPGTIFIANHPTIVDATFLLAELPDTICIFKPSLMRNPAIGPAAIMAGYVSADNGLDLIRDTADRLRAGACLLIFPEGTRTEPGTVVGPLIPSFALIARRAKVPVQLILVHSSPEMGRRGRPWWLPPKVLPGRFDFTLDRAWAYDPDSSVEELTASITQHLHEALGNQQV